MAVLAIYVLFFIQFSLVESRRFRNDFADMDFKGPWYQDDYDWMAADIQQDPMLKDQQTDTVTNLKDNTIQKDEITDTVTAFKGVSERFPEDIKKALLNQAKEVQIEMVTIKTKSDKEREEIKKKSDKAREEILKPFEESVFAAMKNSSEKMLIGITDSLDGLSIDIQIRILKEVIVAASRLSTDAQKKIATRILYAYFLMPGWGGRGPRDALLRPLAEGMFPNSTMEEKMDIYQKIWGVLRDDRKLLERNNGRLNPMFLSEMAGYLQMKGKKARRY